MSADRDRFVALLLAAGAGRRLGGETPKAFTPLAGGDLVGWCARRLAGLDGCAGLVVALPREQLTAAGQRLAAALAGRVPLAAVAGGATRQASCAAAFARAQDLAPGAGLVLVHDAARPFFPAAAVRRALSLAAAHGGAVLGWPVRDSLKRADADGRITGSAPREALWAAATPQVFRRAEFARMLATARSRGLRATDEAGLAEAAGVETVLVPCHPLNLKITHPEDLELIPVLAPLLEDRPGGSRMHDVRVGIGFDRHPLVAGRPCRLAGVELASEVGPAGHSDGDAVLHALTDALLGAAGLDDLGTLYPDDDPRWRDCDSARFVREACARLRAAGLAPLSADVVVRLDRPKLAPERARLRANLAALLGLPADRVNLKGKTHEGRESDRDYVEAWAVVLVGTARS